MNQQRQDGKDSVKENRKKKRNEISNTINIYRIVCIYDVQMHNATLNNKVERVHTRIILSPYEWETHKNNDELHQ